MSTFTPPSRDSRFRPGLELCGFALERIEDVPEIDGEALVFTHEESGLRLLWLANDDIERVFSITFKTPPADDTGVFHILEHSVLDGSEHYPVKEPFVELLKTSMATFLNAFTFPDKTMYPVASTNVDDLENLIDVYFDAVFHPDLHARKEIFEQEGWHFELEDADAPLKRNGVVLNEMKGALSDPDDVLYLGVKQALFPHTCYRFESGGDPKAIPSLTYDAYCDTHRRHYRPSNGHAVLYGDLDIERELAFLDARLRALSLPEAGPANPLELQAPTGWVTAKETMATSAENAAVAVGIAFAKSSDRERILATDILLDALAGSNEAPLKRAVLQSGLGREFLAYVVDGCAQPFILFELKGAKPDAAAPFKELLVSELTRAADEGIDRERLAASLASTEFELREGESSYPLGITYSMLSLCSWLYDEDDPLSYIRYEGALEDIKKGLPEGLFEELLGEILASEHACTVELAPSAEGAGDAEEAELAAYKAQLSAEEIARIVEETKRLHELQAAPEAPEALATLPRLRVDEIGEARMDPELERIEGTPLFVADLETHGIDYVNYSFDLEGLATEDLGVLSILASALGKLPTRRHSAEELDTLVESKLGDLSFAVNSLGLWKRSGEARTVFATYAALLPEHLDDLISLTQEIWLETDFSDLERIRAVLTQTKLWLEQSMVSSGHVVALSRIAARSSHAARIAQHFAGIEFYRELTHLVEHFDEEAGSLAGRLADLAHRVFCTCRLTLADAGPSARKLWDAGCAKKLPEGAPGDGSFAFEHALPEVEAFSVPAGVAFVSLGGPFENADLAVGGRAIVAAHALSYDYLWKEVRVLGGAYGAGLRCGTSDVAGFYSFRDPSIDPTLQRFRNAASWLETAPLTANDVDGYIVACVGSADKPLRAKALLRRLDTERLSEKPHGARLAQREEILRTTPESLRAFAQPLETLISKAGICCIGDPSLLKASSMGGEIVELIGGAGGGDNASADQIRRRQARCSHPRPLG